MNSNQEELNNKNKLRVGQMPIPPSLAAVQSLLGLTRPQFNQNSSVSPQGRPGLGSTAENSAPSRDSNSSAEESGQFSPPGGVGEAAKKLETNPNLGAMAQMQMAALQQAAGKGLLDVNSNSVQKALAGNVFAQMQANQLGNNPLGNNSLGNNPLGGAAGPTLGPNALSEAMKLLHQRMALHRMEAEKRIREEANEEYVILISDPTSGSTCQPEVSFQRLLTRPKNFSYEFLIYLKLVKNSFSAFAPLSIPFDSLK